MYPVVLAIGLGFLPCLLLLLRVLWEVPIQAPVPKDTEERLDAVFLLMPLGRDIKAFGSPWKGHSNGVVHKTSISLFQNLKYHTR